MYSTNTSGKSERVHNVGIAEFRRDSCFFPHPAVGTSCRACNLCGHITLPRYTDKELVMAITRKLVAVSIAGGEECEYSPNHCRDVPSTHIAPCMHRGSKRDAMSVTASNFFMCLPNQLDTIPFTIPLARTTERMPVGDASRCKSPDVTYSVHIIEPTPHCKPAPTWHTQTS